MIRTLHIENYALIDELDITFESGFSVITGETGAGKSILLGAIGLLLGQRADMKALKAGAQRCILEATFNLSNLDVEPFFITHDLDFDGTECIIRRELTATGKSRAFINDTPASLSDLKELGSMLIDIHSQHQNLLLDREYFQLQVLDSLANDETLLTEYQTRYNTYRQLQRDFEEAKANAEKDKAEADYLTYQLQQLTEANLAEGEEEELTQELDTLEHAEDIKSTLYQSYATLDNETGGIVTFMHDVQRQLQSIADVFPPARELTERMESAYIEVRDIAREVENSMERIEYDPDRLNLVNERLSTLQSLKQKFHADSVSQLLQQQKELSHRVAHIEGSDEQLSTMQKQIREAETQLAKLSKALTSSRQKAAKQLESEMCRRLAPLGMPNVQFMVDMKQQPDFSASGCDQVVYRFSANKNVLMQPLSQVASGGEMARLMLVLKAIVSATVKLPTIIFDEIDTGVSGHIAEKMAQIMKEMSTGNHQQVISITHLPQIAALGEQHYRVYKTDSEDSTTSHIVQLTTKERVEELAHMLSGSTLSEAAIANAKALLNIED